MTRSLGIALLFGAVVAGAAYGQMEGPMPPDGPMQGLTGGRGRTADRLRDFDLNHDGKVTHDEMNRTIGARFAAATHHKPGMTLEQFTALHVAEARPHVMQMFRRLDWNGDGRISLEDYAAPQRARFNILDKDGSGTVSCSPDGTGGRSSRGGTFGLAGFCFDNDLNRDGRVTRAELDTAIAKRFQAASGNANSMSAAQYAAAEEGRYREINQRVFRRLDRDGDGTLTIAEFAAPALRLFTRLDRNMDGVITPDEMRSQSRRGVRTADARAADD